MNLIEAIALANSGALITRASDKHSDWLWRVAGPVDIVELGARLATLRHGQMFPIAGLERRLEDGKWAAIGALMSHQAKATDWEAFTEQS